MGRPPVHPSCEERVLQLLRGEVPWSTRYLDEFVGLDCAPQLLAERVFPNAKEITESMGAFNAVRRSRSAVSLGDRAATLVAVGDGSTPRTAALFAMRSAWACRSVDPRLDARPYRVDRLSVEPVRAEDAEPAPPDRPLVVVAVHSHADLSSAVARLAQWDSRPPGAPVLVVAVPCCVEQAIEGEEPARDSRDWGILSPQNRVLVWRL